MAKNTTKSSGSGSDDKQKQAYPKGKGKPAAGKKSPFGGGMAPPFARKK